MTKLEISPFEGRSAEAFSISQARTSIGRNPTNDIVVNNSVVSGSHAEILRAGDGELEIRDLGSSNGTFVNDEQVTSSSIKTGDTLRFGDIECHLTEFNGVEGDFFDSLAITQARRAMKKLDQGVPSSSGQSIELEDGFVGETAAGEISPQDGSAPGDQPRDHLGESTTDASSAVLAENETLKARISELENQESDLVQANETLSEKLAEKSESISELSGQLEEKDTDLAGEQKQATTADSAENETLKTRISELEDQESDLVRTNEAQAGKLAEQSESISELSGQLEDQEAAIAGEKRQATSAESAENETLKARISELENHESDLVRTNEAQIEKLAEQSEAITELSGQLKEKEGAFADHLKETAALRAEVDALQSAHGEVAEACAQLGSIQQEIESFEPERARKEKELNDFLAQAEATRAAAIEENAEVTRALETSREQLASLTQAINEAQQEESALIERVTESNRELEGLRQAEADALTRIEERKAQLSAIQQEIESHEPQRARQQQELDEFLAQAEAAKVAAIEEDAEVTRALKASRGQLESLNQAIRDAQQEENVRIETVTESTREMEERRRVEADALTQIEDRKAAAKQQLNEIADSTEAMETKCARIETQVAKEEKALKKIHRKIGWRKKLLARLKTVARREREVAKKMEQAERVLEGVETHHQPGGTMLPQIQPWDVDQARAERDEAIGEARKIREEADLMEAKLKDRQAELERIEAGIRQKEQPEPVHS